MSGPLGIGCLAVFCLQESHCPWQYHPYGAIMPPCIPCFAVLLYCIWNTGSGDLPENLGIWEKPKRNRITYI